MSPLPDELERLAQALALAEGFQLVLAECHDLGSEALLAQVDAACARASELRGVPPLVLVYDPRTTTDAGGGLRDEAWVEHVLGAILALPRPIAEGASLVALVDGTAPDDDELPSWIYLLHRLNERRNALARALDGTLLLALAPPLVRLFLHEAPDAASIRSAHLVLSPGDLPAEAPLPSSVLTRCYSPELVQEAARLRADVRPHPRAALATLHELLTHTLTEAELLQLAHRIGHGFADELPSEELVSFAPLAHEFIAIAERRGLLGEVLDELRRGRPAQRRQLDRLAASLGLAGVSRPSYEPGASPSELIAALLELSPDQVDATYRLVWSVNKPRPTRQSAKDIVSLARQQGPEALRRLAAAIAVVGARRS